MHELAIIQGVVHSVEEQKKKHAFSRLKTVELLCGKYNCLSQETLQFWFANIAESEYMSDARIAVTRMNGEAKCLSCGMEFEARGLIQSCPHCLSQEVFVAQANTVYVYKLEVV